MDAVFKALADATRRNLLDRLHARNGQTLAELCRTLALSRQAVSKHLAVLEAAQLVAVRWQGREKFHYLNTAPLRELADRWIHKYERGHLEALSALKLRLESPSAREEACPSPTSSTSPTSAPRRSASSRRS